MRMFFSDIGLDIFEEHSGVIFYVQFYLTKCYIVQLILPNVTLYS